MTPTLLLLPGLLCDEVVWSAAIDRLPPHLPVAVGDFSTQDNLTRMAEDMLARHPGPLYVAGHSMGGRVAMEMARLAPERVARLALLDTGIHPRKEGEEAKRQRVKDIAHQQGMVALAAEWLPPMVHPDRHGDATLMGPLTAMVCRMTPELHDRQIQALLDRPDAAATIGAYRGPVVLIVGRQDAWSPVAQHEEIAALLPQAKLVVIEEAGHFAPIERPREVAEALAAWALT